MLRLATRIALVLALIGALGAARAQAAGGIGNSAPSGQAILRQPQALAFDADGNLLVGDRWGYAVQRFDGSHALSGSWGEFGAGNGQFGAIGGIAVGPDRSMYVLDIDQDRVEKFVPDGGGYRFALAWGGFDIRFKGDLAVGPNGRVYVADTYNHRVVWFDSSGRMLGQLGETNVPGADARHFSYPEGIAFDAAGDLYVADDRNNRIQKFSPAGALLASIGQPGELDNPYDVGVDSSQNVYVADNMHHRVVKYAADTAGLQYTLAATWGGRGDAPGQMLTPRSIVVQPDGTNYVTDTGGGRIAVFDSAGTLLSSFGLNGRDGGRLTGPMGLALDQGGSMLVADALQYRVQRLAADGSMAAFVGSHGDGAEQLWLAEGAAAAADGGTWVADTGNNRVQRFDAAGNATAVIGGFSAPRGIAVDGSGSVFVADTGAGRVVKLDANGAQLAAWGGLQAPADVAVNGFGVVYVADSAAKRVVVLDGTGKQLSSWDGTGTNPDRRGPAAFDTPTGVGIDPSGNVWVADPGAAHLSKFAPDGTWLANYGARGHGAGEFWTAGPRDVAAADGYALASDPYDNEVDRIDTPPAASAPAIANGKAWDIGAATAAVGETLDTHGLQTSYWLELGETTAYGRRMDVGSASSAGPVALRLAGLSAKRAYHYRLVAANAAGLSYGPDATMTTGPALQLRTRPQRLRTLLAHGIAVRVRAGERAQVSLRFTLPKSAARRVGLRTSTLASAKRIAPRTKWQTIHVRLSRHVRTALARHPRRLSLVAVARTSAPRGSATARISVR